MLNNLTAISPIDGRYHVQTKELSAYFSEFGLIRYRVKVEILYLEALAESGLEQLNGLKKEHFEMLRNWVEQLTPEDAEEVKKIEKTINHDVKAVEYFIKKKMEDAGLGAYKEFVHFGLTSQDINNTAHPMMVKEAIASVYLPALDQLTNKLTEQAGLWAGVPMLARTHGQPASPTRLGKEWFVFIERIQDQLALLSQIPHSAKFGGATGNFNAHHVAYPRIDWKSFANTFVSEKLGLKRQQYTTQIDHYDHFAAICQALSRINTILTDFCRDIWTYISIEYFKQIPVANEVGSSAMPHKVNPIDFENAEGNLGIANALFQHFAEKLPISRMQRDLTDSTVLRNIGVPFGHTIIALKSILKGLSKVALNKAKLEADLEANWMIIAEGIQSILRREGYEQPYEQLKALTRGNTQIGQAEIHVFIDGLSVSDDIKEELKRLRPENYIGIL